MHVNQLTLCKLEILGRAGTLALAVSKGLVIKLSSSATVRVGRFSGRTRLSEFCATLEWCLGPVSTGRHGRDRRETGGGVGSGVGRVSGVDGVSICCHIVTVI